MFWLEEDIEPAVNTAREMFGTVGTFSFEKNAVKNAIITSDKYGHLWYGDIEDSIESINQKCSVISQKHNISVSLINMV